MSTVSDNPDLIARLTRAQNHPANVMSDIMSFAGLCDDRAELLAYVERHEATVIRSEGLRAVSAALQGTAKRRPVRLAA